MEVGSGRRGFFNIFLKVLEGFWFFCICFIRIGRIRSKWLSLVKGEKDMVKRVWVESIIFEYVRVSFRDFVSLGGFFCREFVRFYLRWWGYLCYFCGFFCIFRLGWFEEMWYLIKK